MLSLPARWMEEDLLHCTGDEWKQWDDTLQMLYVLWLWAALSLLFSKLTLDSFGFKNAFRFKLSSSATMQ